MKILLVKTTSMGDVIHALPALTDACHAIPNISCDWVIEDGFAEIPSWHKAVDKVLPIAIRRWRKHPFASSTLREIRTALRELRATKYDYVIDAQGLIKSALVALSAKGSSFGMNYKTARDPFAALFYNNRFHIPKQQHAITRIRQLFANSLGYQTPTTAPDYGITATNTEAINHPRYLVFIHSTSKSEKCWPVQNWIELAKLATANGYKIKLPWGNREEQQRATQVAEQCTNVEVLPKMNLTAIKELLSTATASVAVDTGLGHLSAALAVPTVTLYGKTKPKLIGTMGENQSHDHITSTASEVWKLLKQHIIE